MNIFNFFSNAEYDIEHALAMYALDYVSFPAAAIYEKEMLEPFKARLEKCHIYIIGYLPKIILLNAAQEENLLNLSYKILEESIEISFEIPDGFKLKQKDLLFYLENSSGQTTWPYDQAIQSKIFSKTESLKFEVKYIGQSYGKNGSRNAIDRLLKHETLQKISLKGVPNGYDISLLLLSIQSSNNLITLMNPFAKNQNDGEIRIKLGIDKLFNTTEEERISLYEACLIRYFYPEFNKEFKDSFPSTNLKILQDCYEKDFGAVIAEICHDEIPFKLWSKDVSPSLHHIAKHNLHKNENRRIFFGI